MENLVIQGTSHEPTVEFTYCTGELIIEGTSLPENVVEFYEPIFEWINTYSQKAIHTTHVYLNFEYLNTASTNIIARIIDILQEIEAQGKSVLFTWYYDQGDYDMRELAYELFEETDCKFSLEVVNEYFSLQKTAA